MSALDKEQRQRIEESRRKALSIRAAKAQQNALQTATITNKPGTSSAIARNIFNKQPEVPSWLDANSSNCIVTAPVPYVNSPSIASKSAVYSSSSLSNNGTGNEPFGGSSTKIIDSSTVHSINNAPIRGHFTQNSPSSAKQFYGSGPSKEIFSQNQFGQLSSSSASTSSPSKTASETVQGKCVLVSRERFLVDVGYYPPLIAMFKNMASKEYDQNTKKWSFELGEYSLLLGRLKTFCGVAIEPLPRCVLISFSTALSGVIQSARVPDADLSGVDSALVDKLMSFQREGVNFAISRNGRVLLADDMGLGKTIQALCVAAYYKKEWPLLIVVPSSVRFAWREQILRWLPSVEPQEINVVITGKESSTTGQVNILSYDLMVRQQKELLAKGFQVIIMDESHFLKNQKTARTQVAFPLLKKARRVLLLSGTPALSRPAELFIQLSAIDNRLFPRFHEFGVRYCDGKQMQWGWDFTGSSNLEELQLVVENRIMIRRLKKQVLHQLPSKVRQMIVLDSSSVKIGKQMKASHNYVDNAKGSNRRSALLEYFHETGAAKKKAVREYVMDQLESDCKILVFAHHQEVLDEVEQAVAKKHGYIRIDGRTSAEQRNVLCDRFQKQDTTRVALLSICAANAGLNLTAASLVVFAELFWNPGVLLQAEDRAHRIGQQCSVSIHYLVATGTADDFVWPLVQNKLDVLGKAGLSKEDFTQAQTIHLKDPRQRDIMSYFEESFFEDDIIFDDSQLQGNNTTEHVEQNQSTSGTNKTSMKSGNLFQYFTSEKATNKTADRATANHEGDLSEQDPDWLDDEILLDIQDDDPDAPWPKKPRVQ